MRNSTGVSMADLPEEEIGAQTLRRLSAAWPRRATIRTDLDRVTEAGDYAEEVPDYPLRFLPFAEHPDFQAVTDEQRRRVLTLAWLVYNERVVTAEEYVANPTFAMIAHGVFPGADRFEVVEAVQQAHIDETWHTYLHMIAMRRTRELRNVTSEPHYPHAVTYRMLLAEQAKCDERWQRDMLSFVWTVVSEISVNAYLELLSRDETIQPLHSLVTRLHSRDESAHGPVMLEVAKAVYAHLDRRQREFFTRAVPTALRAFVTQDFEVWPGILRHAGVAGATDIVNDSKSYRGSDLLVRDFSGVKHLIREMELDVQLDGF
ncbi:diiron oxygenase [Streptosporangium algeriense]|uniref:Diiron oxygenase n=1 Tax=Streptosporangium algeriense TaxID=1682748 RepID=A0ABW3DWS6_9ACTN